MKKSSLSVKIISSIIIILAVTFLTVVYIVYNRQRDSLIENTNRNLNLNSDTLLVSLQNMMLEGKAPIMVNTMRELQNFSQYSVIAIYRTNMSLAFSDTEGLDFVNDYQDDIWFDMTERLTDSRKTDVFSYDSNNIFTVLGSRTKVMNTLIDTREVEQYVPIFNRLSCMECHGSDHSIRGVAHIKVSVKSIYTEIKRNRNFLIILFGGILAFLLATLFFMLRGMVLKPVIDIQNTVIEVGKGDFDVRATTQRNDEIGILANEVNDMIVAVGERVKLSRYVSNSTENLIKQGGEIEFNAERKNIVILFSDIRSFTSYSESNPPETVIKHLNVVLQAQAEVIVRCGGDIDKFVGDEIMAIFEDEYCAVRAAAEMVHAVIAAADKAGCKLRVGIGINSGEVVAGNIGHKERLEYAVIGDTVNLASRLCSIARPGQVLVSEEVFKSVRDKVQADLVEGQKIKGKQHSVNYYIVHKVYKQGDE